MEELSESLAVLQGQNQENRQEARRLALRPEAQHGNQPGTVPGPGCPEPWGVLLLQVAIPHPESEVEPSHMPRCRGCLSPVKGGELCLPPRFLFSPNMGSTSEAGQLCKRGRCPLL